MRGELFSKKSSPRPSFKKLITGKIKWLQKGVQIRERGARGSVDFVSSAYLRTVETKSTEDNKSEDFTPRSYVLQFLTDREQHFHPRNAVFCFLLVVPPVKKSLRRTPFLCSAFSFCFSNYEPNAAAISLSDTNTTIKSVTCLSFVLLR